MLIFGVAWLWFFRRECRFPQALLLIPAGVLLIWLLNGVRIATLILIGNAGAPGIAAGGFHSQAGWIAFNSVALGFCFTLRRVPWLMQRETRAVHNDFTENAAAAYLAPFLAIVAAGMISRASAAEFEWLYPLRFFAAAAALWFFRRRYAHLDWTFGWFAPAIGAVVLVIWLAFDGATGRVSPIPSGLASWHASARITWIAFRTLAAVVTVPIAEELAFRGFLIRRLISVDFESLDSRKFTYTSVLISSLVFGVLHGDRWLAGTVAGVLYAVALLRRGRIGDAVVAHATTNALLAAWVLIRGDWYLW
jgi:exosortase E/protease (VPEID-CTERM system)